MKGLLWKDFGLMKSQQKFFIVVIIMAVFIGFTTDFPSFISGYVTFILPMFALSTISYDEFDNGNAFLFTLPISRKTYVAEKYVFTLLLGVFAVAVSLVLSLIFTMTKGSVDVLTLFVSSIAVFGAMLVVNSFMLPLQLKFGAEKGRIVMLLVCGIFIAAGFVLSNILVVGSAVVIALTSLLDTNPALFLAAVAVLIAAIFMLSMTVSFRIMKKKEF